MGNEERRELETGELDLRRMQQLIKGGPTDHGSECLVMEAPGFDLNRTIFKSLQGAASRSVIASRVGIQLFWTDTAALRITHAFRNVPRAPDHDLVLKQFLLDECNFSVEHADGSFMDHLRFCYEYSSAHYKENSPRVLLLHSIMGVGTNFFPMEKSKIPKLQSIVSDFEFNQIESFPSVLRLLYHGPLLDELSAMSKAQLDGIQGLRFHRVIDNALATLNKEGFWAQLNYQVIHLLDFLPVNSWKTHTDDSFLDNFTKLHRVLQVAGQLKCVVNFDASEGQSVRDGRPITLGMILRNIAPSAVLLRTSRQSVASFSNEIGHTLSYELLKATKNAAL